VGNPFLYFYRTVSLVHPSLSLGSFLSLSAALRSCIFASTWFYFDMAAYDSQPLGSVDKHAALESRGHASRSIDGDESEEYHQSLRGYTRADRADMERMGKVQELKRNYRPLSALAFTVILQGTWEVLLT
jgi:hypothetical protein